ncbi:hypothetical protein BH11PSE3_BH11PSE3_15840 [soil metagenome]
MATMKMVKRITISAIVLLAISGATAWIAHGQQTASESAAAHPVSGPLIARGYTDAPAGTVVVASDPNGGYVIKELRIKEGQMVKRDVIIAVLSNYPVAEVTLQIAENNLKKAEKLRDDVLKGTRVTDIALEEDTLKSSIESNRLRDMQRERSSGSPPAERDIDIRLQAQALANLHLNLALSKARLVSDLAAQQVDIDRSKALVDNAIRAREEALVRSPIDGVVTQIFARQGELAVGLGIAKIVDMSQLRIFATVDELHLPRLKVGAPVEITFRGNPTVYKGTIAIAPLSVKRTKRSEADLGEANVKQVEVEIKANDGVNLPQMLGREARVIFL